MEGTQTTEFSRRERLRALAMEIRERESGVGSHAQSKTPLPPVRLGDAQGPAFARSAVHEWFQDDGTGEPRDRSLRPPLALFAALARQVVDADAHALILWIGRRIRPYARLLIRDGEAPQDGADRLLLERSLFVDVPRDDAAVRLWAIDLALRSTVVAAVVADGSGFDMAHTRRLQLAAEHSDSLVLIARPMREVRTPSAAAARWRVTPVVSSLVPDATSSWDTLRVPSRRMQLEQLRCKGVQRTVSVQDAPLSQWSSTSPTSSQPWLLEWIHHAQDVVSVSAHVADRSNQETARAWQATG